MLTLYYCQTSYASHKVRIYLAEKNITFKAVHIDLRKQEHITSDYRHINPNGTVPSLIDDQGNVLVNSTDIMFHLERQYPVPALLPADQQARDLVLQLCHQHEALHDPYIRTLSYYNMFMNAAERDAAEVEHIVQLARNHPNPERGKFLERAIKGELTIEEVQRSESAVIEALAQMQRLLESSDSGFMVGTAYSIADCVCTASAYRINQIGMSEQLAQFGRVVKWYEQMVARVSFSKSLEPIN